MSITVYDEFISAVAVSGTLGDLIDGIVEGFANEKIDESKSREFYNIVGDLKIEEYEVFNFSVGFNMEFKQDILREEEVTKEILREILLETIISFVRRQLLERVMYDRTAYKNIKLKLDNDVHIEATYTLGYS